MTYPELLYNGRTISVQPLNLSLAAVATALLRGWSVAVNLEPGDATRYDLVLVPCWAVGVAGYLDHEGVPAEASDRYLVVSKLGDGTGVVAVQERYVPDDLWQVASNGWSQELLGWWLGCLSQELLAQRARRAALSARGT